MDSVACQFSVKQVFVAPFYNFFFVYQLYTQRKVTERLISFLMRFTNNYGKRSSFFEELNTQPLEIQRVPFLFSWIFSLNSQSVYYGLLLWIIKPVSSINCRNVFCPDKIFYMKFDVSPREQKKLFYENNFQCELI